ncbi:hypothetical protein BDZ89DRAFT_1042403 [Hymenopellis radicata]|nr:hypothetical protein BDZ89DRAFT_1042403 [Hymenopellis radicata]
MTGSSRSIRNEGEKPDRTGLSNSTLGHLGDPIHLILKRALTSPKQAIRVNFCSILTIRQTPRGRISVQSDGFSLFLVPPPPTTTTQCATVVATASLTIVRRPLECGSWSWLYAGPAAVSMTAAEDNERPDNDQDPTDTTTLLPPPTTMMDTTMMDTTTMDTTTMDMDSG